jgi:YggT family protein
MNNTIETLVMTLGQILSILILVDALLSFMMPPTSPVRAALGRILQPMYAPIRRVLPSTGMFDFSPIVLLIIIQLLVRLITTIL